MPDTPPPNSDWRQRAAALQAARGQAPDTRPPRDDEPPSRPREQTSTTKDSSIHAILVLWGVLLLAFLVGFIFMYVVGHGWTGMGHELQADAPTADAARLHMSFAKWGAFLVLVPTLLYAGDYSVTQLWGADRPPKGYYSRVVVLSLLVLLAGGLCGLYKGVFSLV